MNFLEACQYLMDNPDAVLQKKSGKEFGTLLRKRGRHISTQILHPVVDKYEGPIPIYVDEHIISSEWEDTHKTFKEIVAYIPELRKKQLAEYNELMKTWVGPPPL